VSIYTDSLKEIQKQECPDCNGWGTIDDAEPGDTYYNEWTCPLCEGSGVKPTGESNNVVD
jgi:DnaJ-class molecular chaperone